MLRARTLPAPRRMVILVVSAVIAVAGIDLSARQGASEVSATSVGPAVVPAVPDPPNIVLVTTDDQRADDLRWMPRTRARLGRRGITFRRMLSPHPLCCPARAEILTGQYGQNNGVLSNGGRWGGYKRLDEDHTLATWLSAAGYHTAFAGKHLNRYRARAGRDPGWTRFNPLVGRVYRYTTFTAWNDGRRQRGRYLTDYLSRKSRRYVRRFAADDKPFFIWTSYVAPHASRHPCGRGGKLRCGAPPIPARRHRHLYPHAVPPSFRSPAFNEKNVSDKHPEVRDNRKLLRSRIRRLHLARIRSLGAVDEAVAALIRTLRRTGELRNTFVLFTSDNGHQMGEHRLVTKNQPFEESLRVPLLVRGPRVPAGRVVHQSSALVDLAVTILDLARAEADLVVDGQSLVRLLRAPGTARHRGDTQLIQAGPRLGRGPRWFFRGVRTTRYTYARYGTGRFRELYDRRRDPAQLRNVARSRSYRAVVAELERRTRQLEDCEGRACNVRFGRMPRRADPQPPDSDVRPAP
jgi:N-acetylglucosamine-6-sulfatase